MALTRILSTLLLLLLAASASAQQPGTTYGDRFRFTVTGCTVRSGAGSPEGAVVGSVCDIYVRSDASGSNPAIYTKLTGTATNTGWVAVGGASLTPPVVIERTDNAAANYQPALDVGTVITSASAGLYPEGIYGDTTISGDFNFGGIRGIEADVYAGLSAGRTLTSADAFMSYGQVDSGTVTWLRGYHAYNGWADGDAGAVATNQVGVEIDDLTAGTTNYAIRTNQATGYALYQAGVAPSYFGGPITTPVDSVETTIEQAGATNLTDNVATTILTIAMANGARTGGELAFTIEATDVSNDNDVATGGLRFAAQRKGAAVTCSIAAIGTGVATKSHGGADLTVTATCDATSGTSIVLKLTADTALTPTTFKALWHLRMLKGHGAIS